MGAKGSGRRGASRKGASRKGAGGGGGDTPAEKALLEAKALSTPPPAAKAPPPAAKAPPPAAKANPSPREQAASNRSAKGAAQQRAEALTKKVEARVYRLEVEKRKIIHADSTGRLAILSPAQKQQVAKINRSIERADRQTTTIRDAAHYVARRERAAR